MESYDDGMPVLLETKDFDVWLDCPLGPEALKPGAPAEALREWKVSPRLSRTGVGDDDLPSSSRCPRPRPCFMGGLAGGCPSLTMGSRCLAFAHRMRETDAGAYRRGPMTPRISANCRDGPPGGRLRHQAFPQAA
jgi:hypothetical protein